MISRSTTQQPRPAVAIPASAAEWAARIVARHPHLARPVAEALQLAEAGHVSGNSVHCMVINSKRTTRYSLDYDAATGTWTCTCPAYQYRPYRAGRTAHCKHTLARAIAERAGLIED